MKYHELVQHYLDHKADYHNSYFASWVKRAGETRFIGDWENSSLFAELQKTMIMGEHPFEKIMDACFSNKLSNADMQAMIDNMPSGWERAQLMERLNPSME